LKIVSWKLKKFMSKKKIIVLKYFCLCLLWVLFFKVDFVNSVIAPIFENFNFEIKNNLIKEGGLEFILCRESWKQFCVQVSV